MTKENSVLTQEEIRARLLELADPGYREFHGKLLPGTDNILGVRVPALRKLAKEIVRGGCVFFTDKRNDSFAINNWAVCDVFCSSLKDTAKHREEMWEFLKPCLSSGREYEIRFALVMMLGYFTEQSYLDRSFAVFDSIRHEAYYVRMALAWAVSVYFVKFQEETFAYLKKNRLDDWTYNKALQKITESYRVDGETKIQIRAMKRK